MTNFFDGCITPTEVKDRWRTLSRLHHPDRGGDIDIFQRLSTEYDAAMKVAMTPIKCPKCRGVGRITEGRGFHNISMPCKVCKGTGRVQRGEV